MNWNKVINVFILIFLLLNIVLWYYQQNYEKDRYTLSDERVSQMNDILGSKQIISYNFDPKYYPKSQLELQVSDIDKDRATKTVLGSGAKVSQDKNLNEISKIENESGVVTNSLTFYSGEQEGYIFYKSFEPKYVPKDMTESAVEKTALQFAKDLFGADVNMEMTYITDIQSDDGHVEYRIELNERFKEDIVFQTFVKLYITKEGINEALAVRYEPVDYIGSNKNIYPYDEVIYSLIYYLEEEEELNGQNLKLEDIDIGYYLVDVDERRYEYQLDPHYRLIFLNGDTFYINAYTNDITRPQ